MTVSVLVPYGGDCPHRARAWEWVRNRYHREHPDWEIVEGHCEGPWSKGAAVADAAARAGGDVYVIADADVWCDTIAVDAGGWAVPHRHVWRLSAAVTEQVLAGEPIPERPDTARNPYQGVIGGGLTVLPAELYAQAPIDPRFVGWGGEDQAAGYAWTTLAGKPFRGRAPLWHLWHPPEPRHDPKSGIDANEVLRDRYAAAKRQPVLMRQLVEEARRCLSPGSSSVP